MTSFEADAARVAEICRRYGSARLEIFGSASRGELVPGSDLDPLYDLRPRRAAELELRGC